MACKVINPYLAADFPELKEQVNEHEEKLAIIKGGVVVVSSSESGNLDLADYPAGTLFVLYEDKE